MSPRSVKPRGRLLCSAIFLAALEGSEGRGVLCDGVFLADALVPLVVCVGAFVGSDRRLVGTDLAGDEVKGLGH